MLLLRMIEERFHRDVEDRPIREGRLPKELLRPDDIEYKPCPYAGSRHHHAHPMNVSALRQTSAHWDELIETLGLLRAGYTAARGRYDGDPLELWRVSQLGSALPWFHILRGQPVPAHAAALSKATLGVGIWAQAVVVKMIAERWAPPALTAPEVLALAERSGTLVGATEVCSAPEKMLLRFFDVLVGEPGESGELPEQDAVLRFGASYQGLKYFLWIYFLARRFLYADVAAALGHTPAELRPLREAPCEPPDFFVVEPGDPAALPPAVRAQWFGMLAGLLVPWAPDGSDGAPRNAAERLAGIMGQVDEPGPTLDALVLEVGMPLARPLATYLLLDTLLAAVITHVELQVRAALGTGGGPVIADAACRDRIVASSPRAYFATLAPSLGARSTP